MPKGGNNPRGRSSATSKPYDVSNSFVKRVATRVTELLPQPTSWFSRWMSPASADFTNHLPSTSRPAATSRADLNLVPSADDVDNHVPAKRARTNQYGSPSNQINFLSNDIYDPEELSPIAVRTEPAAVPGPSTARPDFIASTPAVTATKVNGDDCSETSESTSGCSSLVPQAQSTIRSLGGSRFSQSHAQTMNVDSLHRRRPSFSTTTFTSPLRSSMRERLGSSPFYSGRTMYGGSAQAYVSMVPSPQRRVRPNIKPAPSSLQSQPLSSTAKCILDALEHFSSPVMDARRIPVNVGTKRKAEPIQRYAELSIPSTPDLLRVKRRERLQQSTSAARQTATTPTNTPQPTPQYSLRKEEDVEDKKHNGKVRTKQVVGDDSLVEVKLPSVSFTVDKLPKIDIAVPPPPPVISLSKPKTGTTSTSCSSSSSKFTFSSPTVVPVTFSSSVNVLTSSFTFSRPIGEVNNRTSSASSKSIDIKSAVSTLNSLTNTTVQSSECKVCKARLDNASQPCPSCKPPVSADKPKSDGFADFTKKQTGGTWECSLCMIRNKNDAQRCVACETLKPTPKPAVEAKPATPAVSSAATPGFGDMFKKPAGSWECDACMVRNEPSRTSCVACETPKPGNNVSNNAKPPQSTSGFGDLFKKPEGSWTCNECMVPNSADKVKCVACETVKPGASVPKPTESTGPKFSFGIPPAASAPSSTTTFSFGVNNVDQAKPTLTVPNDKSQASTASTFQFGIPKSTKTESDDSSEVSSSSSAKPTFQFGTGSATKTPGIMFSFGSSSSPSKPNAGSVSKRKLDEESKPEPTKTAFSLPKKPAPAVAVSAKSETEFPKLVNDVSEKSTLGKTSTTPPAMFSFGSNKKNVDDNTPVNSQVKPFHASFMFEAKQGSNFPSSTTNTLSTSVSSNVFKFGETKTVPSGSTSPSVSAVSSQPSSAPAISKNSIIFSFGSSTSTEKKEVEKNTVAGESKPSFSTTSTPAFSTTTTPSFGITTTPSFATTTTPSFGTTTTPSFGTTTTPAFGTTTTPAFGTTSTPAFGTTATPAFGTTTTPAFGTTTTPAFGATTASAFGTTTTPVFGSTSTNSTFGTAGVFSAKKDQPSPFAPQTTSTNLFGNTEASSTTPTFGQSNAFATATQENKPSPIFAFGSTAPKEAAPTPAGGFSFPSVAEKPATAAFNFGGAQANPVPSMFNSAPATTPSATFNFEPKGFGGSPFAVNNDVGTSLFGAAAPQPTPAPVFAFGSSQPAVAPATPMFNFSSNQQATPAASTTFQFGASNSTPAQPTFDPTAKPTFNFSQNAVTGQTPVFTATPAVNSTGVPPSGPRRIRKAVRRTNTTARPN